MRKINDTVWIAAVMAKAHVTPLQRREDRATIDQILDKPVERPVAPEGGRNKPCQCGSGKKFKKCCWVQQKERK